MTCADAVTAESESAAETLLTTRGAGSMSLLDIVPAEAPSAAAAAPLPSTRRPPRLLQPLARCLVSLELVFRHALQQRGLLEHRS